MQATGFDADHVRWELPLSEAWPYYHSARLLAGESFRWPQDHQKEEQRLDAIRARFSRPLTPRHP